eukprot:TRINITY_DN549_c2_g1_i1.p1 TRINITY_DN549_c2_g1~~TRINITY_DN549_c2_g1_i1.p1  ORF type:complete len:336 (-),score=47.31 TRINITY_DN549_c2_g1_i1:115-1122(-)
MRLSPSDVLLLCVTAAYFACGVFNMVRSYHIDLFASCEWLVRSRLGSFLVEGPSDRFQFLAFVYVSVWHSNRYHGTVNTISLVLWILILALVAEGLSLNHIVPMFGEYHFFPPLQFLPDVLNVPGMVLVLWLMTVYPSYVLTLIISSLCGGLPLVLEAVIAALVTAATNFAIDPVYSTLACDMRGGGVDSDLGFGLHSTLPCYWSWLNSDSYVCYHGVPVWNSVCWFATSLLMILCFSQAASQRLKSLYDSTGPLSYQTLPLWCQFGAGVYFLVNNELPVSFKIAPVLCVLLPNVVALYALHCRQQQQQQHQRQQQHLHQQPQQQQRHAPRDKTE